MRRKGKPADPDAASEASRYENPIPSRKLILNVLTRAKKPLDEHKLAKKLKLDSDEDVAALGKRLRAMVRDGQLLQDRRGAYAMVDRMDLVHCRVQGHRDGYGFAMPLGEGDDMYLNSRQMHFVFDTDEVLVQVTGEDRRGRLEGKVVEVLARGHSRVVGRYQEDSGIGFVIPDNGRLTQQILIPPDAKGSARPGHIVTAEITDYPTRQLGARGRISEILGDHLDPGLEIDVAVRGHGIPWEWPEEVLSEAAALADEPAEADKRHRFDLRDKPFVTIDDESAQDFDDAIYCEKRSGGGWNLWVAIADVSHYVRPGAALDEEAAERGNSVYFPGRVVPMLPEALSNGLCSLKPGVDRLAMVCEMELSRAGNLSSYCFYEGVIHSAARLTYTQVGEVLERGSHPEVDSGRVPDLQRLHTLYKVLHEARGRRGAIDFETQETRIIFDEQRKIDAIVPVQRNDAHKLIEECMLAANVATARFYESCELPILYRVHEGPSAEKLEGLRKFLGELGLELTGGDKPTPLDYQRLLEQARERDDAPVIQTMLLRSLSQAVYRPENRGHFGLNYPAYAHFTSPIRRYPDLLVHRGIRHLVRSRRKVEGVKRAKGARVLPARRIFPYDTQAMAAYGEHCSMSERRADDATREVEAWLKCEYLQEHVGDEFDGVIAAVTGFGLFVELVDLYIEGLVHVTALPRDYYHFEPAKQRLTGERSGGSYRLGGRVRVRVARVDLDDRKIDLEMIEEKKSRGRGGSRRAAQAEGKPAAARKGGDNKKKGEQTRGKRKPGGKSGARRRR